MTAFDRITHLRQKWEPYDNRSLRYRGLAVCLHFIEFTEGRIAVELIPQSDVPMTDCENWPVHVLSLSDEEQAAVLDAIDSNDDEERPEILAY